MIKVIKMVRRSRRSVMNFPVAPVQNCRKKRDYDSATEKHLFPPVCCVRKG